MKKITVFVFVMAITVAGLSLDLIYNVSEKTIQESTVESNTSLYVQKKKEGQAVNDSSTSDKESKSIGASEESSTVKPQAMVQNDPETARIEQHTQDIKDNQPLKEMETVKKIVPVTGKVPLAALVLSKLSSLEISELQDMLKDGITAEEEARAKQILYSRFSVEDIELIKEAYIEYSNR